ncbi:MAG: hypothetical protein QF713_01795, partial [Dehalococcoidales bacterium]|nr:hypothetical protein [Dehalococcoidales bacterium]
VTRCLAGWSAFETRPVIGALMEKAEDIRQQQLDKTLKKLRSLSEDERYSLDAMTKSIVTKILQDPIRYLKENKNSDDSTGIVGQLFQLEMEERGE